MHTATTHTHARPRSIARMHPRIYKCRRRAANDDNEIGTNKKVSADADGATTAPPAPPLPFAAVVQHSRMRACLSQNPTHTHTQKKPTDSRSTTRCRSSNGATRTTQRAFGAHSNGVRHTQHTRHSSAHISFICTLAHAHNTHTHICTTELRTHTSTHINESSQVARRASPIATVYAHVYVEFGF